MDLFEEIRETLGCDYIYDIRMARLQDARRVIARKNLTDCPARELADISYYLYCRNMFGAEKTI